MNEDQEHQRNQNAYRQMKEDLAAQYPEGHFVAISEGRVIADAADLKKLIALVKSQGREPSAVSISI